MNLFLDDFRKPADVFNYMTLRIGEEALLYNTLKWEIKKDYEHFIKHLEENGLPKLISFDHDLADEHYEATWECGAIEDFQEDFTVKTGFDCAKYLVDYAKRHPEQEFPKVLVHSTNPYGSERIKNFIKSLTETNKN